MLRRRTPVQTIDGPRPIESLQVGDLVLTQSTEHRRPRLPADPGRPPQPAQPHVPRSAGRRAIVSSHFHRFWVAGRGWVMARDLKAGDPIRTLGGVAKVEAIEADKVQLVYNLDVADDADFFAGPRPRPWSTTTPCPTSGSPRSTPPAVAVK